MIEDIIAALPAPPLTGLAADLAISVFVVLVHASGGGTIAPDPNPDEDAQTAKGGEGRYEGRGNEPPRGHGGRRERHQSARDGEHLPLDRTRRAAAWGNRQPTYAAVAQIMAQLQRVTAGDLMLEQQSALNIQGLKFRIYIDGQFEGVVRPDGLGGDMIKRLDGTWWKVTFVLDRWVRLADPNT